jgi:hypothetical protein
MVFRVSLSSLCFLHSHGYLLGCVCSVSSTLIRLVLIFALQNAFSKLATYGFDLYKMIVVDILHDFLLGVWKAIFTHLIWILHAIGQAAVDALDSW